MQETDQRKIFEQWLHKHRGLLFKVVRAYAFENEDREDLFQEISVQLWKSIPSFKGASAVTTWIYRVALYSAMSWSKKEGKHHKVQSSSDDHLLFQNQEVENPKIDWLYKEIGSLDKVGRSLMLLLLDGYSYKEISVIIGIGESNVGVKINRIKKKLRSKSKEYNYDGI